MHDARLCALASNPALPATLIDALIEFGDADLLVDVAEREDLSAAQIERLLALGGAPVRSVLAWAGKAAHETCAPDDDETVARLALSGRLPTDLVAAAAAHPDARVRVEAAGRPELAADTVAALAADAECEVLIALAESAVLPPTVAHALARHPDRAVRSALAGNVTGSVPGDVLAGLVVDGGTPPITSCGACRRDPTGSARCGDHAPGVGVIRERAAGNPDTPAAALIPLVDDFGPDTRAAIAARRGLPAELLERLARFDMEARVRAAAAENPDTPVPILRLLAYDGAEPVRRAVAANPEVPLELLLDVVTRTRLNLRACVPRIEAATLRELRGLARSRTARVRTLVSARRDLPDELRHDLVWDADGGVAKNLADHPSLDADDLRLLAARHGPRIYSAVARNPNCPPELLHTMARNSETVTKALREIARHPATEPRTLLLCLDSPEGRRDAAQHPSLPADVMAELLTGPDEQLAAAAARNPSLPESVMRELIEHARQQAAGSRRQASKRSA